MVQKYTQHTCELKKAILGSRKRTIGTTSQEGMLWSGDTMLCLHTHHEWLRAGEIECGGW